MGTFAKTLSAGLRSGYIAAAERDIDQLTDLKMLTMVNSSGYVERVVSDLIVSGQYRRHLSRLRERIEKATATTIVALKNLGMECLALRAVGTTSGVNFPPKSMRSSLRSGRRKRASFSRPAQSFIPTERLSLPAMRVNIAYGQDPRFGDFYKHYLKEHGTANGSANPAHDSHGSDRHDHCTVEMSVQSEK